MKEIDINGLIKDYENGLSIYDVCEKYKIGKLKVKDILKTNNITLRKRGKQPLKNEEFVVKDFKIKKFEPHEGYHYVARDRKSGFETNDYMNLGGKLTSYIEREYGILSPTLYDRRLYYMRTGNYWWEQWFDIVEVKDREVKKCPYCNWVTNDIENRSGAFSIHILKKHRMTKMDYLEKHPEDKRYFSMANLTANLQMESDKNKFVVCKICGKKLRRISSEHLSKHNITKKEYIEKYGKDEMVCNEFNEFLVNQMKIINSEMVHNFSSKAEHEIIDSIKSFGVECGKNRKILNGKELDIFIPSHNLAIEYNGNLWHSENYGKDKKYHLNKLDECNKKGVKLVQIFEDEYMLHKDIVLSKLKHLLKLDYELKKMQGRKCYVEVIDKAIGDDFFEKNHIQGTTNCSIMFGAFYKDELIAVMSFLNENDGNWNLVRYASRIDVRCQGIASKLFTAFVREYNPRYIRSFADRRWTVDGTDNLYTKLGFRLEQCTKPNYTYYNSKVDRYKRFHKFGFKKEVLINKYGFNQGMSELEMARELGYDRIWDCGLFKYVWKKDT